MGTPSPTLSLRIDLTNGDRLGPGPDESVETKDAMIEALIIGNITA